jgi:Fe-S oxidoreductase
MDSEGLSEWALVTALGQEGLRLSDAARLTYEDLERRSPSPSVRRRVKPQARQTGFLCPALASQPSSALSREFVRLIERAGVDPLPQQMNNGRMAHRLSFASLRHVQQTVSR